MRFFLSLVSSLFMSMLLNSAVYATDTVTAQPTIIHGVAAQRTQVPWQVALFIDNDQDESGYICSGTLIDPQWVLTAAHCVKSAITGKNTYYAVAGTVDLNDLDNAQVIQVVQVVVHPSYQSTVNLDNDIALLKLEQPLDLARCGANCRSISWVGNDQTALAGINSAAQIAGWGRIQSENNDANADPYPALLQLAQFKIINCPFNNYEFAGKTWPLSNNMMCAIGANTRLSADTCEGDSGAGLVVNIAADQPLLAGITSWGEQANCGERSLPGVYTRASNYDDWILSYVNPVAYAERIKSREQAAQQRNRSSGGGSASFGVILGLILLSILRQHLLKTIQ